MDVPSPSVTIYSVCTFYAMTEEKQKRVSIAFTTEDFNLLYSLQQATLYNGKSRALQWQLSNLIKAVTINAFLDIFLREIGVTQLVLMPFLTAYKFSAAKLPTSRKEFQDSLAEYFKKEGLNKQEFNQSFIPNAENPLPTQEEKSWDLGKGLGISGMTTGTSEKTSNFIMNVDNAEFEILDLVRDSIQTYIGTKISISELVRTLFRSLLIPDAKNEDAKIHRDVFLSSVYMGSLYNIPPEDSVLIFSGVQSVANLTISKNTMNSLGWIDRDEVIFYSYKEEMDKELESQTKPSSRGNKHYAEDRGYDLTDLIKNKTRDMKYVSAVTGFSFHSAFIGCVLFSAEWEFNDHKLPLIATYLGGDVTTNRGTRNEGRAQLGTKFSRAIFENVFTYKLEELYKMSKNYREKGKLRA